jgi:hypothetical protein
MKPKYALATHNKHGNMTYWTGKFTDAGRPSTNVRKDNARAFDTTARAYYDGSLNKRLCYFRVVRLYSDINSDGFISGWWLPQEEDSGHD